MLTVTRERGLRHTLFFPSGRCRKREPERLVVEVNIISVAPNKAWLFSFWDFKETFYNMEQVQSSRQWGTCLWRVEKNTNDQDSCRLMDWNISSMGRINCTPPVLSAWHRAWAVLDWSNEGPSAGVWDLLCFLAWKVGLCAPNVPMRVSVTPEVPLLSWKELNLCYSLFLFFTRASMTSV